MAKTKVDAGVSEYLRKIGRKGGKAKVSKGVAKLSAEDRKTMAKKAAAARWGKKPNKVADGAAGRGRK